MSNHTHCLPARTVLCFEDRLLRLDGKITTDMSSIFRAYGADDLAEGNGNTHTHIDHIRRQPILRTMSFYVVRPCCLGLVDVAPMCS